MNSTEKTAWRILGNSVVDTHHHLDEGLGVGGSLRWRIVAGLLFVLGTVAVLHAAFG